MDKDVCNARQLNCLVINGNVIILDDSNYKKNLR